MMILDPPLGTSYREVDPVALQKLLHALEALGNPELVPVQSWIAETAREALDTLRILSTKQWSFSGD
jgi:hypothetical protein